MPAQTVVRVPASSANLGPGFDTLGLALRIYLTCIFREAECTRVTVSGRDSETIAVNSSNLILQTAEQVATSQQCKLPPIVLEIKNDIPVGKGLGSSAAALVSGVVMANTVLGFGWNQHRVLDEAARIEGHPDNVAAAVLGSVTTAAIGEDGITRAIRLDIPRAFSVAVVCPDFVLSTLSMRETLPGSYSRADVIFNIQRATLLVAALLKGDRNAFPVALEDRLHQPYRISHIPGMDAILKLRMPGLLGCALSGAGPGILVFYETGRQEAVESVCREFEKAGCSSEAMFPDLDRTGLIVTSSDV